MQTRHILVAVVAGLAATPALSCAFHHYAPAPSLVETLRDSPRIVLARTSEAEPYRFADVTGLRGTTTTIAVPFLVDSATRRRLAASPEDRVLFALDPDSGAWRRLAYVDAGMRVVLHRLMERLAEWTPDNTAERYRFFAELLAHEDRAVHELALRELDTADYRTLRSLPLKVDAGRLLARLDWHSEIGLKPIRVLLLGLIDEIDEIDAGALLTAGVERHSRTAGPLLGAFATAAIERGGPAAAMQLAGTFLIDPSVPLASRGQIVEALAIHSSAAGPAMALAVRNAARDAIRFEPALAPAVARHFGTRSDFSQADAVRQAMARIELPSMIDRLVLRRYVGMAKAHEGQARPL